MAQPGFVRIWWLGFTLATALSVRMAGAAPLDERGDITLSVRAYTAARIGTQDTDIELLQQGAPGTSSAPTGRLITKSLTFPISYTGHLRQSRTFVEAELDHNLNWLVKQGFGPLALLDDLPFRFRKLGYTLTYRGEYEGVYDYGPSEYRTHYQYEDKRLLPDNPVNFMPVDIGASRSRLRNTAVLRNRLFQAYVEGEVGKLFIRFGRQILAWGETDVFRLLDNINPLDNSFGGFLIPLDERRVPLDMLRMSYAIGEIPYTPFYEAYLEGFAAIDNKVGWAPGVPDGSPWQLPNFLPSAAQISLRQTPPRTIDNARGGVQFKWISEMPGIETATFSLVHYYTFVDTPAVQVTTQNFPLPITSGQGTNFQAVAAQTAPKVQISGATTSFAIPPEWSRLVGFTSEPIIRSELAYFHNEPRWSQSQLDPFVFSLGRTNFPALCPAGKLRPDGTCPCPEGDLDPTTGICVGPRRTGDSWSFMLGMDTQQRIRFLNPDASFFITTQFFYRHLNNAVKRQPIVTPFSALPGQSVIMDGEVLPVTRKTYSPDRWGSNTGAAEPEFVHNAVDQYLQTLLIFTTYYGGMVNPSLGVLFDWSGSVVVQPQLTLVRDPFRLIFNYNFLWASDLRGNSGTSLLRDRDNLLFQIEYSL